MLNGANVITMEQRTCPFMLGEPCMGSKCALWMRYDRADGKVVEACAIVLNVVLQEQTIIEAIRTQAAGDKVATEVRSGFDTLIVAAAGARRRIAAPAAPILSDEEASG